jgi:predicted nucleic-acid-binding Zn-ribbon protein
MILKCITKETLINIELKQYSFKVVDTVPFKSKLGAEIIAKHGLEWLYNNRYAGVSPLACVCQYELQINADFGERITMNEFNPIGVCGKVFEDINMERILINLDREIGTINHFSTPKLLGYTLDHFGTNLMFDVVVDNNSATVKKLHCNKMWKNCNYTDFYKKWVKDKDNLKEEGLFTSDTFLHCLHTYFRYIENKNKPENIAKLDELRMSKLFESTLKKLDTVKDFVATQEMIDKKRLKLKQEYENERRIIND